MSRDLSNELHRLLGDVGFLRLLEGFAGSRLFVPEDIRTLAEAIGLDAAKTLSQRYRGATIRIPLAREYRAERYHQDGLSNQQIARKLGMTETGVEKMFQRIDDRGVKMGDPRNSSAQLNFFD